MQSAVFNSFCPVFHFQPRNFKARSLTHQSHNQLN